MPPPPIHTDHESNDSNLKFMRVANSVHKSFSNLFTGGAEHRKMMHPEACAAIVKVVCLCTDVSKFVAQHISCQWSSGIRYNASNLKDNMMTEYSQLLNQWRKHVAEEKMAFKTIFPRTTLAQTKGFRAAIREETHLMELIKMYTKIQMNSPMQVRESHCKTIAVQAAALASVLTGLVKESELPGIQQCLTRLTVVNCTRKAVVNLASKEQKYAILTRLQSTNNYAKVMALSNLNLYVISYDTQHHCGFIFIDSPVHVCHPLTGNTRSAEIYYIETLPSHRKSSLAKRLLQWVKATAKKNGYQSLCTSSIKPSGTFWAKCGYRVEYTTATLNLNPMSVENLVNRALV